MDKKRTVLVTGGCGYIGSHILHLLHDNAYDVVVVDDLSSGTESALPAGVTLYRENILQTDRLTALMEAHAVDTVIHMAAFISVEESVQQPLTYYRNNVDGTRSVLQACIATGVRKFIFSSTAAVYETATHALDERAPTGPVSPYGHSKLMAEQLVRDTCATHPLQAVILRYFNVAGADPAMRTGQMKTTGTHLILAACAAAQREDKRFLLYGDDYPTTDGSCIRDFIHVTDLAAAHIAVMEKDFADKVSLFNCGYGRGYSVKEILQHFQKITGVTLNIDVVTRRPGDAVQVVADGARLLQQTNWKPLYQDLDIILQTAWDWYQRVASNARFAERPDR